MQNKRLSLTLLKKIEEQDTIILVLLSRISELEEEVRQLKAPKKNSGNSSVPPSQDPYRNKKTNSLREKSGNRPGGQQGHKGSTLEMSEHPTEVKEHVPHYCNKCGNVLSVENKEFIGRRQVIDIPPIIPTVTEHRIFKVQCCCGHVQESDYPAEAHSTVCYGPNITAMTGYFHTRQYLPFDRMREAFSDLFNLEISSGTLNNMLERLSEKATPVYNSIHDRITSSTVVGADETGVCVNGKNHWAWTFQTLFLTYIFVNFSRGKKAIDEVFPSGFPNTLLVHDCWKPYFSVESNSHQICTAHLLRELNYLEKLYDDDWSASLRELLLEALRLKRKILDEDADCIFTEREQTEQKLDVLLEKPINEKHEKLVTFRARIEKYRKYLFSFLYRLDVPPDNNGSERAVRNFKVKQKVSGLFRSDKAAQNYAILRSVIDTTRKNNQNALDALMAIARS